MKEVLKLHRENQSSQAECNYKCTIIKTFMENANLTPTAGFLFNWFPLADMFPWSVNVCVCVCLCVYDRERLLLLFLLNISNVWAPCLFRVGPNIFSLLDMNPSGIISQRPPSTSAAIALNSKRPLFQGYTANSWSWFFWNLVLWACILLLLFHCLSSMVSLVAFFFPQGKKN